jgi:hypothetical protein
MGDDMTILAKMPPGLAVGMRIKTNELYLKINRRCQPREGTIIAPSSSTIGRCLVHLDGHKSPHALDPKLFDVIGSGT